MAETESVTQRDLGKRIIMSDRFRLNTVISVQSRQRIKLASMGRNTAYAWVLNWRQDDLSGREAR